MTHQVGSQWNRERLSNKLAGIFASKMAMKLRSTLGRQIKGKIHKEKTPGTEESTIDSEREETQTGRDRYLEQRHTTQCSIPPILFYG